MHRQAAIARLGAASVALVALSSPAATPFDTPGPFVQYFNDVSTPGVTLFGSNPVDLTLNALPAGQLHVVGQGAIGVAKIGVAGSGTLTYSGAWAGWNDTATFTSRDDLAGSAGVVTFNLDYSWLAQIEGSMTGSAFIDVNLLRGSALQYASITEDITRSCGVAGQCGTISVTSRNMPAPTFSNGVATFQFNVVFGAPYKMVIGMNAFTQGTGTMSVDATHSLYWGGITSVTAGGVSVPYQVSALSGVNYSAPVPEAPIWALWSVGLLAICAPLASARRRSGCGQPVHQTRQG